jgi:hypothetical protein
MESRSAPIGIPPNRLFKFSTKYLYGIGAGSRFDADSQMNGAMLSELRFSYQYERERQIVATLNSLGVSQDEITAATHLWTVLTLRKLSAGIARDIGETDKQLAEKFAEVRVDAHENPVKPDVLRKFLRDNHVIDKAVVELVDDYEHLFETGEVRRPDVFPVGIQP